jgi:protocatechuate 3,4-dioxygenase beta subunit
MASRSASWLGRIACFFAFCAGALALLLTLPGCGSSVENAAIGTSRQALGSLSVQGTVRDISGNPVASAQVELRQPDGGVVGLPSQSGADGRYSLLNVDSGTYDVVVTPPVGSIFLPQTFKDQSLQSDTTFDIVLVQMQVVAVRGRVLDADGNPVAQERVCLDRGSRNPNMPMAPVCMGGTQTQTDADGRFVLQAQPGSYTLGMTGYTMVAVPAGGAGDGGAEGGPPPPPSMPIYSSHMLVLDQTLALANDTVVPDVSLPRSYKLSGRVLDPDSLPVVNATVSGSSTSAHLGSYTIQSSFSGVVTDQSGSFETSVLGGTYTLQALATGRPSGSVTMTIASDTQATIVLPATFKISGRVLDADGNPVAQEQVCLDRPTSSPNLALGSVCMSGTGTQTDADGRFVLQVLPGSYALGMRGMAAMPVGGAGDGGAEGGPPFPPSTPITSSHTLVLDQTLALANDTVVPDVALPRSYKLSGRVLDPDGLPVANATISGSSAAADLGSYTFQSGFYGAVTDPSGSFETSALEGTYTLQASATGRPSGSVTVTIASDTQATIVLPVTFSIRGRVLDADGNPVAQERVCLDRPNPYPNMGLAPVCMSGPQTQTDADGRFVLQALPGSYTVGMTGYTAAAVPVGGAGDGGADSGPPSPPSMPITFSHTLVLDQTLALAGNTVVPDVSLPRSYRLSGRVVDPDTFPVANATVSGSSTVADLGTYAFQSGFYGAVTDPSGRFESRVFAGTWQVSVSPQPSSGLVSFSIAAVPIGGDLTLAVSVQFLTKSASNPSVPAGGSVTTDQSGSGATPSAPVQTTVTTPVAGAVSIQQLPVTEVPPSGFWFRTQQVNITAPAASASAPLVLTFLIDCSRLPAGCDPASVVVFRNAVPVLECTGASGVASPDPCVSQRARTGDDVRLTVLTSEASHWNFALAPPPPPPPLNTAPLLSVPSDSAVEANGSGGSVVTFSATATDAEDGALTPTCLPSSGSVFALGVTPVTCSVKDSGGLSASKSFQVTVADTTPPVFGNVPAAVSAFATSTGGAKVTYALPTATDTVDGARPVSCTPAPGSQFPVNKTTVTCTAADGHGNTSAASFTVWVTYQAPTDGTFFLRPIRANGTSIFQVGRPVPVKFQLTGASKGITALVAKLVVTKISAAVRGTAEDASDEAGDDTELTFKYRPAQKIYGYRWKTSDQTQGTYQLQADLGDGVLHQVNVSLKASR